jgi:hypothetical protein
MQRLDDPFGGRTFVDGAEVIPGQPAGEAYGTLSPTHERDAAGLMNPEEVYTQSDIDAIEALENRQLVQQPPQEEAVTDEVPMRTNADGQLEVDDGSDASGRSTQLQDGEGESDEIQSAPGPLPAASLDYEHSWSEEEQAGAARWSDKIAQRLTEWGNQRELEISEEDARELSAELLADYADLQRELAKKDRVHAQEAKAALAEYYDLPADLHELERRLKKLPGNLGEIISTARAATGMRLINDPDYAGRMIYWLSLEAADDEAAQISPESANEEAALETLMRTDIDQFQNGLWRDTGISPSERLLQLSRRRATARAA